MSSYTPITEAGIYLGDAGPTLAGCSYYECSDSWIWYRLSATQEGRFCALEDWPACRDKFPNWRPAATS